MITSHPIATEQVLRELVGPDNGAVVTFAGVVRSANRDREVAHIRYEAYVAMAERELARIVDEALLDPGLSSVRVIHRIGDVSAGEPSLFVAVAAPHRAAAFAACARIVSEIKRRVPIWKREFYVDGTSEWI